MLSEANFLILDEPTNHLDIASKEILEEALNNYSGTLLYVSHDRYFINSTASRILELVNRTFVNYIGNYDYYLEKKRRTHPGLCVRSGCRCCGFFSPASSDTGAKDPGSRLSWQEQKNSRHGNAKEKTN